MITISTFCSQPSKKTNILTSQIRKIIISRKMKKNEIELRKKKKNEEENHIRGKEIRMRN